MNGSTNGLLSLLVGVQGTTANSGGSRIVDNGDGVELGLRRTNKQKYEA